MVRYVALTALMCAVTAGGLRSQDRPCSYDECALRVKTGFLGPRLVRGQADTKVASIAIVAPSLTELFQRSDSAAHYYRQFRARNNRGFWLTIAGTALYGGSYLVYRADRDLEGPMVAVAIGGAIMFVAGGINELRSVEPLSRAVWWYNRSFTTSP